MLTVHHIHKEYRTGNLVQKALDGVSLSFREREFVAVLGPSGSGKTTLLNVIGGLDRYDSGEMSVNDVPTSSYCDRDWDTYRNHTIGFVFQSYNLIPHQSILSNVELSMTLSGVGKKERRERALHALERVGLLEHAQKKPSQLSGGQMQRVAIARALVNEPSILLADEPTGALDSDTGEQVMELLKEVAREYLVIMVTHNPDLANRYANRIIRLRDGKVTEDTNPCTAGASDAAPEAETEPAEIPAKALPESGKGHIAAEKTKGKKKPSMSFATALSLSVSNLLSKKARTILVAFAASIGIVGIALILSLSNGANTYIRRMERDSLSQYPIEITSSAFSMEETMLSFAAMRSEGGQADTGQVTEQQMMGGMLSSARQNDLASLKRWFESGYSGMEEYTRGIDYRYGISPQIYRLEEKGFRQVNPDQTMSAMGVSMDENLTGAMSGYGLNEVFRPLPDNEDLYRDDYTILAGRWPEKDTELVLVLTGSGGIPDMMLYTMGLKDTDALDSQIESMVAGSGTNVALEQSRVYDPEEFLGISFRLLPAYEMFSYDSQMGIWLDSSTDEAHMQALLEDAEEMQIVGVVKPMEGVSFGILELGIEYPWALCSRLIRQAEKSEIVQTQRENPEVNVLTGSKFGEEGADQAFSLMDMISIHPEYFSEAVSFRWEDLDELETDETRLSAVRTVRIIRELSRTGKSDTLSELVRSLLPLLMDLVEIDEEQIDKLITFTMDEAHMQELFASRAAAQAATFEANLSKFGYADADAPMRITIYPADFESKNEVIRLLDAYNAAMQDEGYEEKVITYTDYVGALMSSVTTIIDVITYVLIAFVAVSLVVSSIMIGIITYISVLERRKEIGILRAIGASKRNITEVFNAETFIIGLLAGVFGIGLTLLLQIPINHIIRSLSGQEGIRAFLPVGAGTILVLLCVFLTFLGGFIPSRQAARQDPVAALRSE
ncbi:MAG: ABC transporter ATP-binding protein/permease [Lachnospiraceae bacterium]|nr:ABC transporter ATP-binding protein/permease [Lachnospiraceae bacterium]